MRSNRLTAEMRPSSRKMLCKSIAFLNELQTVGDVPGLRDRLPRVNLTVPPVSPRARRIHWGDLPAPLRASFDAAAATLCRDGDDLAADLIARIEAGEDPDAVLAEGDALARMGVGSARDPEAATERYRSRIRWLVRSYDDMGRDVSALQDVRELLTAEVVSSAITDHITRAREGHGLMDPVASATLTSMLRPLARFARHGLRDPVCGAVIDLLRVQHVVIPRRRRSIADAGELMVVDSIAAQLNRSPQMGVAFAHGPQRLAHLGEHQLAEAHRSGSKRAETSALFTVMAAVMCAIQMSRPQRTSALQYLRNKSTTSLSSNLIRASDDVLRFEMASWESKSNKPLLLSVRGADAAIVHLWLNEHRARYIQLRSLDDSVYMFPGMSTPRRKNIDGQGLPVGCIGTEAFLTTWRRGTSVLGYFITPHRMRHLVGLLILSAYPGNYALVASVLGNSEAVARKYYGRDSGERAAEQCRAAILAAHPDVMSALQRRTRT